MDYIVFPSSIYFNNQYKLQIALKSDGQLYESWNCYFSGLSLWGYSNNQQFSTTQFFTTSKSYIVFKMNFFFFFLEYFVFMIFVEDIKNKQQIVLCICC